jgi:hypothetical protein
MSMPALQEWLPVEALPELVAELETPLSEWPRTGIGSAGRS